MAGSSGERAKRTGRSDDAVLPFATVRSRVGGRIARLGGTVDTILTRHDYPAPVAQALGEALALTALLGNMLKIGSKLILQTKTAGAPADLWSSRRPASAIERRPEARACTWSTRTVKIGDAFGCWRPPSRTMS